MSKLVCVWVSVQVSEMRVAGWLLDCPMVKHDGNEYLVLFACGDLVHLVTLARAESVSSVDAAAGGRGTGGSGARRRRRQRQQGTNQRQQTLSGNDGNNVVDPVSCYHLH